MRDVIHHPHVEHHPALGYVVKGTRLPVRRIYAWHLRGITFELLRKRYPGPTPAQVLDALSFAYDNQDVMREEHQRDLAHYAKEPL